MNIKTFRELNQTGNIDKVCIYISRYTGIEQIRVYAYGDIPSIQRNQLEINSETKDRIFKTIESAYRQIRECGYSSIIEIDG